MINNKVFHNLIILMLFIILQSCAQLNVKKFNPKKRIDIEKVFLGNKYTQNGKIIELDNLVKYLEDNRRTKKIMKNFKVHFYPSLILGAVGGALIGWPLGTSIGGNDANWNLAYAGIAAVAVGAYLAVRADSILYKGVKGHNDSFTKKKASSYQVLPHFSFVPTKANDFEAIIGMVLIF